MNQFQCHRYKRRNAILAIDVINRNDKAAERGSRVLTLKVLTGSSQFLMRSLLFRLGLRRRFIVITRSCQWMIPGKDLDRIRPIVPMKSPAVFTAGTPDRLWTLLGESNVSV